MESKLVYLLMDCEKFNSWVDKPVLKPWDMQTLPNITSRVVFMMVFGASQRCNQSPSNIDGGTFDKNSYQH